MTKEGKYPITDERLQEVLSYKLEHGKSKTLENFGINTETLSRYVRVAKERNIPGANKSVHISEILNKYTDKEIEAIAKGGRIMPGMMKVPVISFEVSLIRPILRLKSVFLS